MTHVEKTREASGHVSYEDPIVEFLYLLMRDHLSTGVVEDLVLETEESHGPTLYTNGWLAKYAMYLVKRLRSEKENKEVSIPKIVCLCGSTRFFKEFTEANYKETVAGNIVLSVGFYPHSSKEAHGEHLGITEEEKIKLDELHKRKIDLADEVLVLNVGGYVGRSTRSEIEYATRLAKPIRYLESIQACA